MSSFAINAYFFGISESDYERAISTLAEAEADGYCKFDWAKNPFAVLPHWIGFSAKKEA